MSTEITVQIVKTETIKPSFPTPNNLKTLRLSLLDQFAPVLHTRVLLFFSETTLELTNQERSKLLRESLSQTLSSFHPFAGRISENHSINCNDEGAEFVETKVHCRLSNVLAKPRPESLIQLVPSDRVLSEKVPLLLIQVNFFECGGLAIGVSVSHKIADAATISHFLNCWDSKTFNTEKKYKLVRHVSALLQNNMECPQFISPPRVPPHDSLASLPQQPLHSTVDSLRLVFHGPRISALRTKLSHPNVPNPTRVEAVLALIWKCAIQASKSCNGQIRHSVLYQAVNLRRTLSLEEKTPANFSWSYMAKCNLFECNETEVGNHLVALIRKGIEEFRRSSGDRIGWEGTSGHVEEYLKLRKSGDVDIFMPTSWCRFPFYDLDFGWGKPFWVCVPNIRAKNCLVLMDTRDGDGIEVCLSLGEDQIAYFQRNQELLEFASFNPSAMD